MHSRHFIFVVTAAFIGVSGVRPARCDEHAKRLAHESAPTRALARNTAERGLEFLTRDAAKWRKEHECSTCHHGTMTVWALCEAKSQGYAVDGESLSDTVKWTKARLSGIDKPRDTRPGWSMVNTPAIYLAVMARTVPTQDAISPGELEQIAGHLIRHQETDGSWAWSSAPLQNRPPPVFESDEVATLLGCMALGEPAGAKAISDTRNSRNQGVAWLAKTEPSDTTQAAALRLLVKSRSGKLANGLRTEIDGILSRQNQDGGWGQLKDLPSDAYATGQVLYVLNLAGVKKDRAAVKRGVAFLVANQREDGSWPMTARAHPGAKPMTNPAPITYFGSAWATLGLMRSTPK